MSFMNANALFIGANIEPSFHQAIKLPDEIKAELRKADIEIRRAIRNSAELMVRSGQEMVLATNQYRDQRQEPLRFEVRFLRQGGIVYRTEISPAFTPPQQSDLDDGVYVRTSFLSYDKPGLASEKFFKLVEDALLPLCNQKGWTLKKKKTCVRVELDAQKHIDLPLYAIPDEEFVTLEKSIQDATGISLNSATDQMLSIFDRHQNLRIPTDRIMLAHREEGWIHSDPRALHDWFEEQFNRFGPQLRRQCRYFKGWRDFAFETGGPSSVALMVCAANAYRLGKVSADNNRDDLAFLEIADSLPTMFSEKIANPVLSDASALNSWNDIELQTNLQAARQLFSTVNGALNGHYHSDITVNRLQDALGRRIPNRPDLVKAFSKAPEIMRGTSAAIISSPLPATARTTSG